MKRNSRAKRFASTTACGLAGLMFISRAHAATPTVVSIDPSVKYQTMTGVGGTLTDSGAAALAQFQAVNPTAYNSVMSQLFSSSNGAGLNFVREEMGASDFRLADYTYDSPALNSNNTSNDTSSKYTDYSLTNFTIAHDTSNYAGTSNSMVSLLQKAQTLNSNLTIMGSPWSAPGWLKTGTATNIVPQAGVDQYLYGGTLVGGTNTAVATLAASTAYKTYAQYFVKYVQAYAALGIKIDTITPQNEPGFNGGYAYGAMTLSTNQQIALIEDIGAAFKAANITTKIDILDHNWGDAVTTSGNTTTVSNNITAIMNSVAAQYVSGVAFHGYTGNVTAQTIVHNAYPTLQIHFTEQTGSIETGDAKTNFANDLMYYMQNIVVGGARNWSSDISKFNIALNDTGGPKITTVTFNNGASGNQTVNSGDYNGRGIVNFATNSNGTLNGNYSLSEEYYALGQIAKFVQPGAIRISSDSNKSVAFLNPNGTTALVAYNDASTAADFQFNQGTSHFSYTIPTDSVVTFTWSSNQYGAPVSVWETTGDETQLLAQQTSTSFVPEPSGLMVVVAGGAIVLCSRRFRFRSHFLHAS